MNKFIVVLLTLLAFSCSTTKTMQEFPEKITAPSLPHSTLNVNVRIPVKLIQDLINDQLQAFLATGMGEESGYSVKAQLTGNMFFQAYENQFDYTVPIGLEIIPNGLFGSVKAKGIIELKFNTGIAIFEDQFISRTTLPTYQWLEKPKVNIFGLNISVERIANNFVNKSKQDLISSIDNAIKENVSLPKAREFLMKQFQHSMMHTDDHILGLFIEPLDVSVGMLRQDADTLHIPISMAYTSYFSDKKLPEQDAKINFHIVPAVEPNSNLQLQVRIPMLYAEQLTREQIVGQEFGSGITKIKVDNLQFVEGGRKIQLHIATSGAYNGKFRLAFVPGFDAVNQKVDIQGMEFKPIEGKAVDKAIFNLVDGIIKRKIRGSIEDSFNSMTQDYLTQAKQFLAGTEVTPGIHVHGELHQISLTNFVSVENTIFFTIEVQANLESIVRQLQITN